jgi:hypothetical protein
MNAIQLMPIEIDPRPCELCGLTIDRHEMVDHGDGPEFFCVDVPVDDMTLDELERRAELRREEAIAAMIRHWEMDDAKASPSRAPPQREYHTPRATIDAFWFVVRLDDPDYLIDWLERHPRDAAYLHQIWSAKCSTETA